MYTTYESEQFKIEHIWGLVTGPHPSPPEVLPSPLAKPKFKPTKLVCVEDMNVIQGSEVKEGYCALSYSWNWSGEQIMKKNSKEYSREDNSKHKIVACSTENNKKKNSIRSVIFEEIIQQICKDFNIRYIWYDQMYIDQTDREQKQLEIQQMHSVYSHASCTVVLIPELYVTSFNNGIRYKHSANINTVHQIAEWSKRAWTLEEAYMSKRLLFIGRNAHMWSDAADNVKPGLGQDEHFFYSICTKSMKWNTSTILWHARNRISTKAHDRIFALANMLPNIIGGINFSYDQDILELMRNFYNMIAATDLSILCFGAPFETGTTDNTNAEAITYPLLPSWSGIEGLHLPQMESGDMHLRTSAKGEYTLRSGLFLCINCSCTTALLKSKKSYKWQAPANSGVIEAAYPTKFPEEPPLNTDRSPDTIQLYPPLPVPLHQLYPSTKPTFEQLHIPMPEPHQYISPTEYSTITFVPADRKLTHYESFMRSYGLKITHWLPIKKIDDEWIPATESAAHRSGGYLSLVDTDCSQCIILSGVRFRASEKGVTALPVVKESGIYYKSIGLCFMTGHINLDYTNKTEKSITIR